MYQRQGLTHLNQVRPDGPLQVPAAAAGRTGDATRTLARVEELRADLDRITALSREAMEKPWDADVRVRLAELCDRMGKPELAAMWRNAAAACRRRAG